MQTLFSPAQLQDKAFAESEHVIRTCVHCGFCTATCPTYVLLGDECDSPRGRIYMIKDMLENERQPTPQLVKHVDRCLSCLSCMTTCPSGVNYMHLVDHARTYIEALYERPAFERVLRLVLAKTLPYPARFRVALRLSALGRIFLPAMRRWPAFKPVAAMLELAAARPGSHEVQPSPAAPAKAPRRARVALLQGCVEPVLRPEIRAATLRLLARCGVETILAKGEVCCGALVHHLGRADEAKGFARRNVDAWMHEIETSGLDAILVTASGCGTMIKDYGFLLRDDPTYAQKAARVSALARDISEFLDEWGLPPVQLKPALSVAYQAACALQHGQSVRAQPKRLLAAAGFTLREVAEAHLCCGSAGIYNIVQSELATKLRDRKLANIAATGADLIASGNIGCMTQLGVASGKPVVHVVELLDWATGGPRPHALQGLTRNSLQDASDAHTGNACN
ncbi:MAG: glycolate oxidase subunit GlcF [Beijerinckiaceae bacterium]